MYAARLLFKEHPNLIFQNLLSCIFVEDDIVRLISSNREVSIEQARKILNIISLNPIEISYYHNSTPDFSTYQDFPEPLKVYNTYRMRAFGYWLTKNGIKVINNIR